MISQYYVAIFYKVTLLLSIALNQLNETNVAFGMSLTYIYRSLFFKKNGFFFSSYDFFWFFLFLRVCDVYKYCLKHIKNKYKSLFAVYMYIFIFMVHLFFCSCSFVWSLGFRNICHALKNFRV